MSVAKRHIPWIPSRHGGPLGRNIEHDERSRAFGVSTPAVAPHYALHIRHGKILDQGDLGSCTGNALTGALMTGPLYRPRHNYGEPTAVSIYKRATVIDGFPGAYPPDDTGSSGLAVCKVALERKMIRGYEHAFGIDQALAALMDSPLITGIEWVSGFDSPNAKGLVRLTGPVRGGHEVLVRGFDPGNMAWWSIGTEPTILLDNSWGGSWGLKGSFVMTVEDWATLLDREGDVTRPLRL